MSRTGPAPSHQAGAGAFAAAIERAIAHTARIFAAGHPPALVATVCGSQGAQRFWQHTLDLAQPGLGAREVVSFYEDLPVNQAFGILLLWQRLRERLRPSDGALVGFVFGEGTRATPFTETDGGQKPAIASFVAEHRGGHRRWLSTVELALRYFVPVEEYLRRSGFRGVVFKWGDEVQIPTCRLSGSDPRFAEADVVRFVSMREVMAQDATNKDWVGVDPAGHVTTFIPRRPLAEMEALADRGILQRRGDALLAGVNLGSIALSRVLLNALLEEFAPDVNDPTADRKQRPDLDPQFFTALTIAALDDPARRQQAWAEAMGEVAAMRKLAANMPDVVIRLRRVFDSFSARHGRPVRMVALDFGDQYWGDIGQHRAIFDFYMSLNDPGTAGQVARALAGVRQERDGDGNIVIGERRIGPGLVVKNSVLMHCDLRGPGEVVDSVLIGTCAGTLNAHGAFAVSSTAVELELAPRAGSYKLVDAGRVVAEPSERVTTLFLPDTEALLRVREDTDLRDRANSYDVPILDNPISFRAAHAAMLGMDPQQIARRRQQKAQAVRSRVAELTGSVER